MPGKKPETMEEMRLNAARSALDHWTPVEEREAARDAGYARMAEGEAALAKIPKGEYGAKSAGLQAMEELIPEIDLENLWAIEPLLKAGAVTLTPEFQKRYDQYKTRTDAVQSAAEQSEGGKRDAEEAMAGLGELQERATLAEAGGDPLKSQMPTE